MLEELLTLSKSRQASQSGSTNAANMDIAPIRALIKESNWQNRKYTEAELAKFAQTLVNKLHAINNRIGCIAWREQPDFGEIRQLLEETVKKTGGADVRRTVNEIRHSFALENRWDWAILTGIVLLTALLGSALYFERRQNYDRIDNDLKYRYIKMKGEATSKRIAELEEIFELNRDNAKIRQMKKDVEEYEQTIQRKVQLEEQARLKEREAERLNKNASRLKNK